MFLPKYPDFWVEALFQSGTLNNKKNHLQFHVVWTQLTECPPPRQVKILSHNGITFSIKLASRALPFLYRLLLCINTLTKAFTKAFTATHINCNCRCHNLKMVNGPKPSKVHLASRLKFSMCPHKKAFTATNMDRSCTETR